MKKYLVIILLSPIIGSLLNTLWIFIFSVILQGIPFAMVFTGGMEPFVWVFAIDTACVVCLLREAYQQHHAPDEKRDRCRPE